MPVGTELVERNCRIAGIDKAIKGRQLPLSEATPVVHQVPKVRKSTASDIDWSVDTNRSDLEDDGLEPEETKDTRVVEERIAAKLLGVFSHGLSGSSPKAA